MSAKDKPAPSRPSFASQLSHPFDTVFSFIKQPASGSESPVPSSTSSSSLSSSTGCSFFLTAFDAIKTKRRSIFRDRGPRKSTPSGPNFETVSEASTKRRESGDEASESSAPGPSTLAIHLSEDSMETTTGSTRSTSIGRGSFKPTVNIYYQQSDSVPENHHHRSLSFRTGSYYKERERSKRNTSLGSKSGGESTESNSHDTRLRRNLSTRQKEEKIDEMVFSSAFGPPSLNDPLSDLFVPSAPPTAPLIHKNTPPAGQNAATQSSGPTRSFSVRDRSRKLGHVHYVTNRSDESGHIPESPESPRSSVGSHMTDPVVDNFSAKGGRFIKLTQAHARNQPIADEGSISSQSSANQNLVCTSYKLKLPWLKYPIAACLLPNGHFAVADYDNGFAIVSPNGELTAHYNSNEDCNACDIACTEVPLVCRTRSLASRDFDAPSTSYRAASPATSLNAIAGVKLFVLIFNGDWSINTYLSASQPISFLRTETIASPYNAYMTNSAHRKIVVTMNTLYLMACSEERCCVWKHSVDAPAPPTAKRCASLPVPRGAEPSSPWKPLVCEVLAKPTRKSSLPAFLRINDVASTSGQRGPSVTYNDISVSVDALSGETTLLLCDLRQSCLSTVVLQTETAGLIEQRSTHVRRVPGQEWIIQGPNLAAFDEAQNVLVYDTSGKLFIFDGHSFRCKKIVADVGANEVRAVFVHDGWAYAVCRYKRCIEAYRYSDEEEKKSEAAGATFVRGVVENDGTTVRRLERGRIDTAAEVYTN